MAWIDKSMVGCYTALFFKQKMETRIHSDSFNFCKVKDGAFGRTGNKGAICIRFEVDL